MVQEAFRYLIEAMNKQAPQSGSKAEDRRNNETSKTRISRN